MPETITIRVGWLRRWVAPVVLPLLAAGLLVFGIPVLWTHPQGHVGHLTLIVVFGLGLLLLIAANLRIVQDATNLPSVTLTLSPHGLTLHYLAGEGTVPWKDIETIGTVPDDWIGRTLGMRLGSYENYLASIAAKSPRVAAPPLEMLRKTRGYEIQVPRLMLDRSVDEFLELVFGYWERYGPAV